jgi:hypothetical protein
MVCVQFVQKTQYVWFLTQKNTNPSDLTATAQELTFAKNSKKPA